MSSHSIPLDPTRVISITSIKLIQPVHPPPAACVRSTDGATPLSSWSVGPSPSRRRCVGTLRHPCRHPLLSPTALSRHLPPPPVLSPPLPRAPSLTISRSGRAVEVSYRSASPLTPLWPTHVVRRSRSSRNGSRGWVAVRPSSGSDE
jgi:hypothetical protein